MPDMRVALALSCVVLIASTVHAQVRQGSVISPSGVTGEFLNSVCAEPATRDTFNECSAYILGVFDGLAFKGDICPQQSPSSGQIRAIVAKYLADHPERWANHGYFVTSTALKSAFPCAPR